MYGAVTATDEDGVARGRVGEADDLVRERCEGLQQGRGHGIHRLADQVGLIVEGLDGDALRQRGLNDRQALADIVDGALGAWIDVPLTTTFLSTPTYTLGNTVAFQPYYARATNSSGTVYFHHTGHSAAASQVYNLTVLEIAS